MESSIIDVLSIDLDDGTRFVSYEDEEDIGITYQKRLESNYRDYRITTGVKLLIILRGIKCYRI